MELLQAIHGRRSVREFTDEPVSDAMLHERSTPQFHECFYHALVLVVIAACAADRFRAAKAIARSPPSPCMLAA